MPWAAGSPHSADGGTTPTTVECWKVNVHWRPWIRHLPRRGRPCPGPPGSWSDGVECRLIIVTCDGGSGRYFSTVAGSIRVQFNNVLKRIPRLPFSHQMVRVFCSSLGCHAKLNFIICKQYVNQTKRRHYGSPQIVIRGAFLRFIWIILNTLSVNATSVKFSYNYWCPVCTSYVACCKIAYECHTYVVYVRYKKWRTYVRTVEQWFPHDATGNYNYIQ